MTSATAHNFNASLETSRYHGVHPYNLKWMASITVLESTHILGVYDDAKSAALVYDMEALHAHGFPFDRLNFKYELAEKAEDSTHFYVKDQHSNTLHIEKTKSLGDFVPYQTPRTPITNCVHDSVSSIRVYSKTCDDPKRRAQEIYARAWSQRQLSSFLTSASFSYEITFPNQNPLGLNLKPQTVMCSSGGGSMCFATLLVVDITSFLSSIIHAGDLLLKVNNTELCMPGDAFDFDLVARLITTASSPRVLRFYRPCNSPAVTLSPAELKLAVTDLQPSAKFNVVLLNNSGANSSIQLTYIDPQAPSAIKKLMHGNKVVWSVYTSSGNPSASVTSSVNVNKVISVPPKDVQPTSIGNKRPMASEEQNSIKQPRYASLQSSMYAASKPPSVSGFQPNSAAPAINFYHSFPGTAPAGIPNNSAFSLEMLGLSGAMSKPSSSMGSNESLPAHSFGAYPLQALSAGGALTNNSTDSYMPTNYTRVMQNPPHLHNPNLQNHTHLQNPPHLHNPNMQNHSHLQNSSHLHNPNMQNHTHLQNPPHLHNPNMQNPPHLQNFQNQSHFTSNF